MVRTLFEFHAVPNTSYVLTGTPALVFHLLLLLLQSLIKMASAAAAMAVAAAAARRRNCCSVLAAAAALRDRNLYRFYEVGFLTFIRGLLYGVYHKIVT